MNLKVCTLAMLGLLAGSGGSLFAQTLGTPGPNCLFPLACPGPVPPMPAPLYGPPEDQAAEQPYHPMRKPKHQVRKHVTKKAH